MGENIRNMALANTITNQIPGIGGTLLANNALDLPDRWLPFSGGRSLALANLITSQFPGPAGALYANQVLDLPDGYLP
nr:hypothetical protein BaRGS_025765 [Batillaria attramentaria]